MKIAALALVLTMVAAGCLSSAPLDAASVDADAIAAALPTGAVFHEPGGGILDAVEGVPRAVGAQFLTGFDATEPTVGVTAEGAVFLTAMVPRPGTGRMPALARSLDAGQTWDAVGSPLHANTNDPLVLVDVDTGRVYMNDILPLSCTFLSWSDDNGETWTTNPYACGNSHVNDHQTIVTAWPRTLPTVGYPKIVYHCANDVAYFACATSLNGGLTFGPQIPVDVGVDPTRVSPDMSEIPVCGATTGHLKAGPDGKVYLPKSECSVQASRPVVYVTEDDGLTWTKKVVAETIMDGHELALAIDEENGLYGVWTGTDGLVYYAYSVDAGDTWSEPKPVSAPGVTATMFTAAAALGKGKLAFAYVGSTVEGGYEGKGTGNPGIAGDLLGQPPLPEWDNATWDGYLGVMTGADTDAPVLQTVTVNDPADPLARGLCGRTRCHGMNDFIDMVVDLEGRPWVAFVDVCTAECVDDVEMDADQAVGFVGTLVAGPSLRTDARELRPLAPPPLNP